MRTPPPTYPLLTLLLLRCDPTPASQDEKTTEDTSVTTDPGDSTLPLAPDCALPASIDADTPVVVGDPWMYLGDQLAVTGEGYWIGSPYQTEDFGRMALYRAPVGSLGLADADAEVYGATSSAQVGFSIAVAGDIDGDGIEELAVGAPLGGSEYFGGAWIVSSGLSGRFPLEDVLDAIVGTRAMPDVGRALAAGSDLDGDGVADFVVSGDGFGQATSAYIVSGPISGSVGVDAAMGSLQGSTLQYQEVENLAILGDVDGDGHPDLGVGSPNSGNNRAGTLFIFLAPFDGERSIPTADALLQGNSSDTEAGSAVVGTGDVNDDGYGDFAVGSTWDSTSKEMAGAIDLWLGPVIGTLDVSSGAARITGSAEYGGLGKHLAFDASQGWLVAGQSGTSQIYALDPDGASPMLLAEFPPDGPLNGTGGTAAVGRVGDAECPVLLLNGSDREQAGTTYVVASMVQ